MNLTGERMRSGPGVSRMIAAAFSLYHVANRSLNQAGPDAAQPENPFEKASRSGAASISAQLTCSGGGNNSSRTILSARRLATSGLSESVKTPRMAWRRSSSP